MDAIVAVYSDWGIGAEGTQPIVIPEDRRHFAKLTRGAAVIVGRRTMEDFPGGNPVPAGSILSIMGLGIKQGDSVVIDVQGADDETVADNLLNILVNAE